MQRGIGFKYQFINHRIKKFLDESALPVMLLGTFLMSSDSSRFDYCNSLHFTISRSNPDKFQRVQNSLARVVYKTLKREQTFI